MIDDSVESNPWSGRFTESMDALVEAFTESVSFDQRLASCDIAGSIAHATMLCQVGVLSTEERDAIVEGLGAIGADIEAGRFRWSTRLEDVHMNIETALTERIGQAGKKLHTGRSRNDQVATDVRLLLREEIDVLIAVLRTLRGVVVDLAEREASRWSKLTDSVNASTSPPIIVILRDAKCAVVPKLSVSPTWPATPD